MAEKIDTLLKESRVYQPTAQTKAAAYIKDYESAYKKSIADPEGFWSDVAKELEWFSPWTKVLEWNYPWAKWFVSATCNITYNCLDRHVKTWRRNKVAVIWIGENDQERVITYGELSTGQSLRECAQEPWAHEGRSGYDLPSESSRTDRRHARLRSHRRHS